jgi:hypothetical protein
MTLLVLLLGGAAAALAGVVLLILVPPRIVRGIALSSALLVLTLFGNDTAPTTVWQLSFVASIGFLLLAVVRSRATIAGGVRFVAVALWWAYVTAGVLVMSSYSVTRVLLYFTLAVLAAWVASSLDQSELRLFYSALIWVAALQALIGILELFVFGEPVWGYRGMARENPFFDGEYDRVQGTMGHPIPYSVLQAAGFIVAWSNPARWRWGWRLLALAVCAAGLVISGTRSAALAVVVALLVHLAMNTRLTTWLRGLFAVGAVGVVLVNIDVGIPKLVEELLDSGSWTHRLGALESVPTLLARQTGEALFGNGFGSELLLYERGYMQQHYLQVVDNMIVYALGTMGVIGLIVFLAWWLIGFVFADRVVRALLVMFFAMFFSFDVLVWMYTGILLSLVMALPATRPAGVAPGSDAGSDADEDALGSIDRPEERTTHATAR